MGMTVNRTQPFAKNMTSEAEDHVMMLHSWFLFGCAGIGHVVFFGEKHPATLGMCKGKGRGRRRCPQGREEGELLQLRKLEILSGSNLLAPANQNKQKQEITDNKTPKL